jgi:hypothetical protein
MQTRFALASALLVLLAAGRYQAFAATLGEPVSAFAANVGERETGAETAPTVTLFVVPDGRTFLLTDVLVANHSEEVGPLYLSDSKNTRCSIALLQMILLPGNPAGFSSFLNVQSTFSTGIPFGPGEPVIATLASGTRGVDVTITGRLVAGPHLRPIRLPGGARDTGDDAPRPDAR